jgi:hypothetical protein
MQEIRCKVKPKWDPIHERWIDVAHERRLEIRPPQTNVFRYEVPPGRKIKIEQSVLDSGQVLGRGTVTNDWRPGEWFFFETDENPQVVDPGRIVSRLISGQVLAIPTGEKAELPKS